MDKALQTAITAANDYGLSDAELATAVEAATAAHRAYVPPSMVRLVHPKLPGRSQLVGPDAVAVLEQSGWVVQSDQPADEAAVSEPTPDETTTAAKAAAKTKET